MIRSQTSTATVTTDDNSVTVGTNDDGRPRKIVIYPRDREPVNEWWNNELWLQSMPVLFPDGRAGPHDKARRVNLSLKQWGQHMLALDDDAFRVHPSFVYILFDVVQRQAVSWGTKMILGRKAVQQHAAPMMGNVTSEEIKKSLKLIHGKHTGNGLGDKRANTVLQVLKAIGQHVHLRVDHSLF